MIFQKKQWNRNFSCTGNKGLKERILRLSDAFENKEAKADVELTVRMLNINHGHNKLLMEKCRVLEEYAILVAKTRDCMAAEKDMQAALNKAVSDCIKEGILYS